MGIEYLPWVSAGYALLSVAICAFEVKRTRASGPDILSMFMALFLLQCCLPGIVIFACLPVTGIQQPTDNPALDRIYAAVDLPSALFVLALTAVFAFFVYAFMALGRTIMRCLIADSSERGWFVIRGSATVLLSVLTFGFILCGVSFWLGGDSLVDRYVTLIELRGYSDKVQFNTLNNFAFLLDQSFLWISVVGLFVLYERRGRDLVWYACLVCAVAFAILATSRRAIFIPVLLAYFTLVLFDGRWRLKSLLAAALPILLLLAFGKEIFAAIAYGGTTEGVISEYETPFAGVLRTASEVGLTLVESLGSINLLDLPPRYGMDHLLSLLRGAPLGWFIHWLGQDDAMPVRLVRLSTAAFATSDDQDIPTGAFGQMWLDFRIFGPILWALAFAAPLSVVQRLFALTLRTRQATAALVLITFVVALPLNSGSYDFSFGNDMLGLALCLLIIFKVVRIRLRLPDEPVSTGGPCE